MPFCCGSYPFPSVAMHYYELYNVVTRSLAKSIRIIIHLIEHAVLSEELIWHESSDGKPRLAPRSSGIVCPSNPNPPARVLLRLLFSAVLTRDRLAAKLLLLLLDRSSDSSCCQRTCATIYWLIRGQVDAPYRSKQDCSFTAGIALEMRGKRSFGVSKCRFRMSKGWSLYEEEGVHAEDGAAVQTLVAVRQSLREDNVAHSAATLT